MVANTLPFFFQSDNIKAAVCLGAECVGDWTTDSLTIWTFSEVQGLQGGFLLIDEPVVLWFSPYKTISFLFRTA